MWNIKTSDGRFMLGDWCDFETATRWLQHYVTCYGTGSTPYPNGKGFYPNWNFALTSKV